MNSEFRHWLELSGLANKELARRIRKRAQAKGLTQVSTEASRVRGWLAGQQPAADVAEIVAEVITEACSEPLTPASLGFTATASRNGQASVDISGRLPDLVRRIQAQSRTDLLIEPGAAEENGSLVTGRSLVQPLERWITTPPDNAETKGAGALITVADCEDLETVTHVFRQWDNRSGGGLRRKAVVGQLSGITDLLNSSFDTRHVRQRLFGAVADLAQLAGWMSYDVGLHSTAQRYYALGLHLAKEAGDRLQGARMLYCMARQLIEVHRAEDALELLDMALYGSRRAPAPKVRTLLLGMRARALANLSTPDPAECERTIDNARQTFAATQSAPDPEWAGFYDDAELAGVIGACYRDLALNDTDNAESHASKAEIVTKDAISLRGDGYQRSRILDLNNLATTYLLMGEPERAAQTGTTAVTLAGRLRSSRLADRFRTTAALAARRYPRVPELQELQERVSIACRPSDTMSAAN